MLNLSDGQLPPHGWKLQPLGSAVTLQRGRDLPVSQRQAGPHPVIGSNGVVGTHSEYVALGPGVLVGRSGSVGKVTWAGSAYWPLNTALWVRDFQGNDPRFVYYLLSYLDLSSYAAGVSVPTLNRNVLHPLNIGMPVLREQRAIADILSRIQRSIEATERVIAAARALKRSVMRHLFTYGPVPPSEAEQVPLKETEIGPVPQHWEIVRLGDVAYIGNGSTPKRDNCTYWDGGSIPWLTSAKVHEAFVRHADQFVTDMACKECHLPLVPKRSVVVAITGQGKTLGHAALVDFDTRVSQHLAYLKFTNAAVSPEYVLEYLHTRYLDLRQVSSGGGSTKGALTCGFLKGYPLPLPHPQQQKAIAGVLRAAGQKVSAEEQRLAALQQLFRTMLHLLMTGQLRVSGCV